MKKIVLAICIIILFCSVAIILTTNSKDRNTNGVSSNKPDTITNHTISGHGRGKQSTISANMSQNKNHSELGNYTAENVQWKKDIERNLALAEILKSEGYKKAISLHRKIGLLNKAGAGHILDKYTSLLYGYYGGEGIMYDPLKFDSVVAYKLDGIAQLAQSILPDIVETIASSLYMDNENRKGLVTTSGGETYTFKPNYQIIPPAVDEPFNLERGQQIPLVDETSLERDVNDNIVIRSGDVGGHGDMYIGRVSGENTLAIMLNTNGEISITRPNRIQKGEYLSKEDSLRTFCEILVESVGKEKSRQMIEDKMYSEVNQERKERLLEALKLLY